MTQAVRKVYRSGTDRTQNPAVTLERIEPLKAQLGITRVANVTGLDRIGVPVVMVTRPNSRSVAVSQGKGLDLVSAKVSGLMESIETWHAENITLPLRYGSYNDLMGSVKLIDPDVLPSIRDSLFHPDLPILWIEGRNLHTDDCLWIPFEIVYCNYTYPSPPGHGCFSASTNGLASGNHMLEAQCHAICEVIERDATTLWRRQSAEARKDMLVDLTSVNDSGCRSVLDKLDKAQIDVSVWETSTDIGVPCFQAMILGQASDEHLGAGAGCHPVKHVALLRALTEAVQTRNTYIAGSRDDLSPEEYTRPGILRKHREASECMGGHKGSRNYEQIPSYSFETFDQDIEWLLNQLKQAGASTVVAVDLTKSDLQLPVVRVVIPELELPDDADDYVPGPRTLNLQDHLQ